MDGWSGGQTQVLGLARGLAQRGHRVVVVARPGGPLAQRAGETLTVVEVPMRGEWDLPSALRLGTLLRRLAPDVVHLHSPVAHTLGGVGARLAGVPVVVAHKRTDFVPRAGWLKRWRFERLVDRMVAISQASRQALEQAGVRPEQIRVIYSSVNTERYRPGAVPPACPGVPAGAQLVAAVGTLHARKGHDVLLRAVALLAGRYPDLRVALVGEGPERDHLGQLAASLGIGERVVLTGNLADVRPVLEACQVVAMPSRLEGLGVSALETMAMGKPLVASSAGGLTEVVEPEQTGLLVPRDDPQALAAALDRLLGDAELRARLSTAARQRAVDTFSVERMVECTEQLYRELLAAKART